jgi:hypothetical protein
MTSIVSTPFAQTHGGLDRVVAGVQAWTKLGTEVGADIKKQSKAEMFGARGVGAALLTAAIAALLISADRMLDTWSDQHLFAAWIIMWALAFATVAVLGPVTRRAGVRFVNLFVRWEAANKAARQDAHMWAMAQSDARVMHDLIAARDMHTVQIPTTPGLPVVHMVMPRVDGPTYQRRVNWWF